MTRANKSCNDKSTNQAPEMFRWSQTENNYSSFNPMSTSCPSDAIWQATATSNHEKSKRQGTFIFLLLWPRDACLQRGSRTTALNIQQWNCHVKLYFIYEFVPCFPLLNAVTTKIAIKASTTEVTVWLCFWIIVLDSIKSILSGPLGIYSPGQNFVCLNLMLHHAS